MLSDEEQRLAVAIGKAIAKQRALAQLTQEELAERLGIGNEAVSRIERGVVIPTLPRLIQMAEIFDCDTAELINQSSPRSSDQVRHLSKLLGALSPADRELMLGVVEQFAHRLRKR